MVSAALGAIWWSAESCQPRHKVVALNDDSVKCRVGQSCHQNHWWFTVCFFTNFLRSLPTHYRWQHCVWGLWTWQTLFMKQCLYQGFFFFFFPSKLCKMLRLCVAVVKTVLERQPACRFEEEVFKGVLKSCRLTAWEGEAETAQCSSLCSKEPRQLRLALFWLLPRGRVWAVTVSFELAQSRGRRIFEGRQAPSSPLLAQLLQGKKRGTRSQLGPVTGLSLGLGSGLASKRRNEKIKFFPLRFMTSGSKRCPGSLSCSSWALSDTQYTASGQRRYSYFTKRRSRIEVLNSDLVWSNTKGRWRREGI